MGRVKGKGGGLLKIQFQILWRYTNRNSVRIIESMKGLRPRQGNLRLA